MSSPLRIFRKYQKQLIVIFGIMLMVSFLIAGSISSFLSTATGPSDYASRVAVRWQYGTISNGQLDRFRSNHARSVEYVRQLMTRGYQGEGSPKDAGIIDAGYRSYMEGTSVDEALVRTMALAKRAEELGMIVDQEAVESYFDRLCDNEVPRSQYPLILAEISQGRMTYQQLINHMRTELLSEQMRILGRSGFATSAIPRDGFRSYQPILSPGAAYDYHKRVFQKVRAELLPLKVEDYLEKVQGSPDDAELMAVFEEGKEQFANDASADPGFRQRRRIAFEYFEADLEEMIQQEMNRIDDAEVQKFYEENKADYPAESGDEAEDVDPANDEAAEDEDSEDDAEKPQYKPLEEVEDEIRRELATPRAQEKLQRSLKNAAAKLKEYFFEYLAWEQDSSDQQPEPPDMNELAAEHGLKFESLPLQDVTQLDSSSLSQALRSEYEHERKSYVTVRIGEGDAPTQYLYWKTDETEEKVPEFDDVRDEVEDAWRFQQARQLAEKDAIAKSAQARESQESLRAEFGDDVVQTNEFSWLSPGGGNIAMGGGGLTQSFVFGVDMPGRDFFETISAMHEGDVAVTHNEPKSVYYVTRIASERLDNDFFGSFQPTQEVNEIGNGEQQRLFLRWLEQLEDEMGILWDPTRKDTASA